MLKQPIQPTRRFARLTWRTAILSAIMVLALAALVACGDDDDDDGLGPQDDGATPAAPADDAGTDDGNGGDTNGDVGDAGNGSSDDELSGTMNIEGSSTVAPYNRLAVEGFEALHPDVTITVGEGGSGAGITALINLDVPVAASSRPIREDEIDQAAQQGLEVHETVFAYDALAVVVHPDNDIESLTFEEVAQIFAGEITEWSDLGGSDGEITVYTRNEESGSFAFVEDDVIRAALGEDAEYATWVNKQANAPAGLTAVSGDPDGIFYAGLGNLADIPEDSVKVVPIAADENAEAVLASQETVNADDYPIARGLFYYTDGDPADSELPILRAFIEYVLSPEGQAVADELHLVPAN